MKEDKGDLDGLDRTTRREREFYLRACFPKPFEQVGIILVGIDWLQVVWISDGTPWPCSVSAMSMTQPQLRTEAELIKSVCAGEREAFYALVQPYERMIYATAISVVKNPADAEEVCQEAVLKAFANLASFRAESKFSTWVIQITYNEARMKLRKARPHLYESLDDQQQNEEGDSWPKDFADWRPISSELLEQNEIRQAVQKAINMLSAAYREVLVLRDIQHLSIKETSTILGISEPSVKTRLHRARLMLRDCLAPGIDGCWVKGQPYRKVRPW